ncbi:39c72e41-b560-4ce9-a086-9ed369656033 [Thermothielavioides terrestris]|uniref:Ubiquitin carboxyl-terminal hydrolase n=1 Tax=Thermothielavioides terrestris TaxID=2587410 RepID=A0A3S4EV43_9PEZI|nr:39c72e41-b560-4ce9-a086-9ed369656033 [Thermothielavioides terrestris]
MATVNVVIKHQGKKYDVEVDTSATGELLKYQLFSLTGVEPERQKILIKGGQLKDDTDLSKLGLKPGQVIMMMGTPGEGGGQIVRPTEKIKFLEDMTEAEAAQQAGAIPAGLVNLGNTCYLNSTLQALRSIPELQDALAKHKHTSMSEIPQLDITNQLKDLFKDMSETQGGMSPFTFLNALRVTYPQFAERSKKGPGYAQQDAEEAWSQIVSQLRQKLRGPEPAEGDTARAGSFVDKYMAGEFSSTLECNEPEAREGGEQPTSAKETFLKLNCHIDSQTAHLRDGLVSGLTEKIEKRSEVLGRDATYTKTSRISRLPKYLTVHFVRFFWKRDVQKKAKIMRKVTFPHELDAVEFCTDELKKALIPVRDKVREVRKDEEDIERARKRRKKNHMLDGEVPGEKKEGAKKDDKKDDKKPAKSADGDVEMAETFKTEAEWEAEKEAALLESKKELNALIDPDLRKDEGANHSGLYELRAVVTHQGASADSGHYTAYVKKTGPKDPVTGKIGEEDGKWWWFNDDKVTEVTSDKIDALAGGGESHSALILLYKAIPLPTAEGVME